MKTIEHIEFLLRQGRKPKELVELGFPKHLVTRVRRRLKEEKAAKDAKTHDEGRPSRRHPQPAATPEMDMEAVLKKLTSLEDNIACLENRTENLEAMEEHLEGTPALGLRKRFKCDCGATGFVAIHVQCTKCGRETWWGWHPK